MYDGASKAAGRPRRARKVGPKRVSLIGAGLALVVLTLNAPASAAGRIPPEPPANHVPVTICHDVNGNGNTGNGYNKIPVDADSIVKQGHTNHGGGLVDIIPPFTYYTLEGTGQNRVWVEHNFPGQGDASLIADNCGSSGPPTEECPDGDFNGEAEGCGVPPVDMCPNIDGVQAGVPPGMEVDENGDCVVVAPPEDVCPDIPGDQTDPAECPDPAGGGNPSPGPTVLGDQASTGAQGSSAGDAGAQGAVSPNAPAVPTNVDAGLAPASTDSGTALLVRGLVGFGFVLLMCAGLLGLRDRRRASE